MRGAFLRGWSSTIVDPGFVLEKAGLGWAALIEFTPTEQRKCVCLLTKRKSVAVEVGMRVLQAGWYLVFGHVEVGFGHRKPQAAQLFGRPRV